MSGKITKADIAILVFIAEYRILTVKLLAALTGRSIQVLRRRLRFLKKEHLVNLKERGFGTGPGRRENIIILTENGINLLKSGKHLSIYATPIKDKMSDSIFIDHDLLRNWFFVHLLQIERKKPQLGIQLIIPSSHISNSRNAKGHPQMERFPTSDDSKDVFTLIPDGVFAITDKRSEKSLLFFLEVDMGSEPLVKTVRTPGDIRHKIICYQTIFQTKRYKRYEKAFNTRFSGFRLLFLTNEPGRMKSICDLAQEMPPSDFIWITTQAKMFSCGIAAEIWAKRGQYNSRSQSILGQSLAFEAAIIDGIR